MKSTFTFFLFAFLTISLYSQNIIISGAGHDYAGNHGFIELYVQDDIDASAGNFYIKSIRDDLSVIGNFILFAPLSAGTRIYITSDDFWWDGFFGIPYTYGAESVGLFQGDDVIVIEDQFNNLIDIYGELGVNGVGTPWEFSRGWAYRLNGFGPNTSFTLSEWNIQDNAFIGCGATNASCPNPYPIGSYTLSTNDVFKNSYQLVPNPVHSGIVSIIGLDQDHSIVEVFNAVGNRVRTNRLYKNQLDVSNLASGLYFVRISRGDQVSVKKLILR